MLPFATRPINKHRENREFRVNKIPSCLFPAMKKYRPGKARICRFSILRLDDVWSVFCVFFIEKELGPQTRAWQAFLMKNNINCDMYRAMWKISAKKRVVNLRQLNLDISRPFEPDRNYEMGGRSFYFFDFDDNVAFLPTEMFLFHKETKRETKISTGEYAKYSNLIGKSGLFKEYDLDLCNRTGSFRRFRDQGIGWFKRFFLRKEEAFIADVRRAIQRPEELWKGPSWNCFYHAVHNGRPISIITARGHEPETIKKGISVLVKEGFLPREPNYLSVLPVSNPDIRIALGDGQFTASVPELKKLSIQKSVEQAFDEYGSSMFHRFGMSDDDENNIKLVMSAMKDLKREYPNNSFYVIHSKGDTFTKQEVTIHSRKPKPNKLKEKQLDMLDL